jgi:hypothetical protein
MSILINQGALIQLIDNHFFLIFGPVARISTLHFLFFIIKHYQATILSAEKYKTKIEHGNISDFLPE